LRPSSRTDEIETVRSIPFSSSVCSQLKTQELKPIEQSIDKYQLCNPSAWFQQAFDRARTPRSPIQPGLFSERPPLGGVTWLKSNFPIATPLMACGNQSARNVIEQ
jgi:hypothetical protein